MKKLLLLFFFAIALTMTTGMTSCRSNSGANCPAYNDVKVKTNKNGKLPTRRGKTNLFPKKMRKG